MTLSAKFRQEAHRRPRPAVVGGCLALLAGLLTVMSAAQPSPASGTGSAAEQVPALFEEPVVTRHLRVATKPFAPFVFEEGESFTGFSIDLWDRIATELRLEYEWVGTATVSELLATVREGRADVAISGITITSEREDTMDFTHPFFQSGLQVLIPTRGGSGSSILGVIFSFQFLKIVGGLFLVLFAAANVLWVLERRRNPEMFPASYFEGVWEAFWWAAVTVTTVGYGDKTPKSVLGRLVAVFWMFAGLIFLGFFTASITTVLTVEQLEGSIKGPEDMPGRQVGTVGGTTAAEFLYEQAARVVEFGTLPEACEAMVQGEVEAVVYDSPALRYYASHSGAGQARVVGPVFMEQSYGIALPEGSDLREPISRALLTLRENGSYGEVYREYFGD